MLFYLFLIFFTSVESQGIYDHNVEDANLGDMHRAGPDHNHDHDRSHHHHRHHFLHPPMRMPYHHIPPVCKLHQNYTDILRSYDKYIIDNKRVFYFAHRNKVGDPVCFSKLQRMIDNFNNLEHFIKKKFTFSCPKEKNQTENILTFRLCFTKYESELIQLPEMEEAKNDDLIKSNEIPVCFLLYGTNIEKCLYDALLTI
mgnify:CR=1 FL=1